MIQKLKNIGKRNNIEFKSQNRNRIKLKNEIQMNNSRINRNNESLNMLNKEGKQKRIKSSINENMKSHIIDKLFDKF